MKIAIWGKNSKVAYSGGRIHAWLMAEALVKNSHEVHYFTNNIPVFYKQYEVFENHKNINLHKHKWFNFTDLDNDFDLIFLVPHLKSFRSFIYDDYFFYRKLKIMKRNNNCQIVKLDFESPNWITSIIPESRSLNDYKYQNKFNHQVDGILSSTQLGMSYAKKYYKAYNEKMLFSYCMPSINSVAADKALDIPKKEKKNTIITRFSDSHKNQIDISKFITNEVKGYTFNIIMGRGTINEDQKVKNNLNK